MSESKWLNNLPGFGFGSVRRRRSATLFGLIAVLASTTPTTTPMLITATPTPPTTTPSPTNPPPTTPPPTTPPGGDHTPPSILAFTVGPATTNSDVSIGWHVADTGGSHLREIRIWRVADSDGTPIGLSWHELRPLRQSWPRGEDRGSGQASDSPPSGVWWYVIQAVDYDGNWAFWPNPIRITKSGPDGLPGSFSDVLSNDWAFPYVEALYRAGYVKGCQETPVRRYCVRDPLNRAEESVFILRGVLGADFVPRQPNTPPFDDVPVGFWAADWINELKERGFTSGCTADGNKYCPSQYNTIAEGAVFFTRILEGPNFVPPTPARIPFLDLEPSDWYTKWMVYAFNAGLVAPCRIGSGGAYICPNVALSRDLAAYMLVNAKGLSITDPIPTPTPTSGPSPTPSPTPTGAPLTTPLSLRMFDDMNGWAIRLDLGGSLRLLRTRDGGKTWKDVTPALGPGFTDWFFLDAQRAWLGALDTGLGHLLWSTQDGGANWVAGGPLVNRRSATSDGWQQIEFVDSLHGWSIVSLWSSASDIDQFVFRTQDSGLSWTQVYSDRDNRILSLDFATDRFGWMTSLYEGATTWWPTLRSTSDGGLTWTLVTIPLPEAEPGLLDGLTCVPTPYLFDHTSGALFIKCSDWSYKGEKPSQHFLYRTFNGGQTWLTSSVPGGEIHFLAAEEAIASTWTHPGWLPPGTQPWVFYRTLDGGKSWEKLSELPWGGGAYVSFIDLQRGWAFAFYDGREALMRTTDGGRSWEGLSPVIVP